LRTGTTRAIRGRTFAALLSVGAHAGVALAFTATVTPTSRKPLRPTEALVEITALALDAPRTLARSGPGTVGPASAARPSAPPAAIKPAQFHRSSSAPLERASEAPEGPTPVDSAPASAPRFVLGFAAPAAAVGGGAAAVGPAEPSPSPVPSEPLAEASVDSPARLLSGNQASYTPEAEAAGIEANVPLEIVVDFSGAVAGARVLTHVGYGLDEAALRGVRGYRFSPARRRGQPVAVRMRWLMRFQLR
jgi:protein TonB